MQLGGMHVTVELAPGPVDGVASALLDAPLQPEMSTIATPAAVAAVQ
jgi:hypothetical protein